MADITKCPGAACPMKESCYRFTAPVTEWRQSWFQVVPLRMVIGEAICEEFWDNTK